MRFRSSPRTPDEIEFGMCDHSWEMTWSGFWDFLFPEGVTAFFIFAAIALSCCIVIRFIFWEEYKKFVIFPRSERFYLVLIAISMVFVVFLYRLVCQIEAA